MAVTVLNWKASRVTKGVQVSGTVGIPSSFVTSSHVVSLLIEGKAASFGSPSLPMIEDGDEVAAAGILKNGVLHADVLRNVSSGVVYARWSALQTMVMLGFAGIFVLLALLFLGFGGIGIAFLIPAYFLFTIGTRTRKAARLLGG
jgi:hypothetical protein